MNWKHIPDDPNRQEAQRLNALLNSLSLFSRRTMLAWLPDLEAQMGITEERFMVMYELNLQPDSNLKDLATSLIVSPSSLSVMINSLVEQGLVTRFQDPTDRRRVVLRLSTQGETQLELAEKHLVEQLQKYLAGLPEGDRLELDRAVQAMLQVVNRILNRS